MESETFFSTITDSATNTTFAVVVVDGGRVTAHGSMKQGKDWADWVNRGKKSVDQVSLSLDPSLRMSKFVPLTRDNLMSRYSSFGPTTVKGLASIIENKSVPEPLAAKSEKQDAKAADVNEDKAPSTEPENEPESEPIATWLLADVGISMFDVQIKAEAINFKARQFARNMDFASFVTCVKGSRATVSEGRWRTMPVVGRQVSDVLDKFDRKIKTGAFAHLDKQGYFEKLLPIGMANLPPPHLVRNADSDPFIYEGIPYINGGRGILDPTPPGTNQVVRGIRSVGGVLAEIVDKPSRVRRMTRREDEADRLRSITATTNDLNRIIPDARSGATGQSRLRRRLSALTDAIEPANVSPLRLDRPATSRERRRVLEGQARIATQENRTRRNFTADAEAAMRNERGDSPETPSVVRAAEQRTPGEVVPSSGDPTRGERGSDPGGSGGGLLNRLSRRFSRISNRIATGEDKTPEPDFDDRTEIPSAPVETPRVVSEDPWVMDRDTRERLLAALVKAVQPGTYATFSSRFGEDEVDWPDFTPSEQSALMRELGYRRDELLNIVTELMTPEFSADKDYRSDGVVTPESVMEAIANDFVSLRPGGVNLYADVMSLVAINDMLSSKDFETEARASAWRMIDNRNRSVVSKRADIQRRDVRDAGSTRIQGSIGERTVIAGESPKQQSPIGPMLSLSKLQPMRLRYQPEKPVGMKELSEYSDVEREAVLRSAIEMRGNIVDFLRQNLGIPADTELTEDMLADWMSRLDEQAAKRVGMYAHNLIVLDGMIPSLIGSDKNEADVQWSSLTEPARNRILSNASVGLVPQVPKTNVRKTRTRPPKPPSTQQTGPTAPPNAPTKVPGVPVPIGMSTAPGKIDAYKGGVVEDSLDVLDVTDQVVTWTLEDGTQQTKPIKSLGANNQYDLTNAVIQDGITYVMERNLGIYRDPASGLYLTDYSRVPISVDTTITPASRLLPVQKSRSMPVRSYPQITLREADANKPYGLNTNMKKTQIEMLTEVLGIDAQQAQELVGKVIYFAPNVAPGRSMDNFRQAAMLLLNVSSIGTGIPDSEKLNLQLLDVVDIPESSDPIETYLNHIGRPDIAIAYVAAGRPVDFLSFKPDGNKTRAAANIPDSKILPEHLQGATRNSYSRRRMASIFDEDAGNLGENATVLVPGMLATAKPRVRKMIVLWRHPDNYDVDARRHWNSPVVTQTIQVAAAVNKALASDDSRDWYDAFEKVRSTYETAKQSRDASLRSWESAQGNTSRTPRPRREFVLAGDLVEQLETIITDIFGPNMHKVADSVRQEKSLRAKIANDMGRMRKRAQALGVRNVVGLEDGALVPPVDATGSPLPPRSPQEILAMLEKHQSLGFLPHIPRDLGPNDAPEISEISDEAIKTLAAIAFSVEMKLDPETGRPLQEVTTEAVDNKYLLHNAIQFLTGNKGRPITVTAEEFGLLGTSFLTDQTESVAPANFPYNFYIVRRGIARSKRGKTANAMAEELINGPLYTKIDSATAGGYGLNFARPNAGMVDGYGGSDPLGDLILAAVPKTARVDNRSRMNGLYAELLEMFGAFFTGITHFNGTEKTLAIDLDATDDPDWRPDNRANPFYRARRPNTAHGYYVPHGSVSISAHRGSSFLGEELAQLAREMGVTIPKIDTADPEAIRGLGNVIMLLASEKSRREVARGGGPFAEDDTQANDPDRAMDSLAGPQWWNATRAQVFGWMIQMEILKSMEIARMKALGKVPWNDRIAELVAAQEIMTWWNDELGQAMLFGVDVGSADDGLPLTTNPSRIFKGYKIGTHVMVYNRSALVFVSRPLTRAGELAIVESVRDPKIRKPGEPSMVWNSFHGKWINDPDYKSGAPADDKDGT